jgi:hypothetical protein
MDGGSKKEHCSTTFQKRIQRGWLLFLGRTRRGCCYLIDWRPCWRHRSMHPTCITWTKEKRTPTLTSRRPVGTRIQHSDQSKKTEGSGSLAVLATLVCFSFIRRLLFCSPASSFIKSSSAHSLLSQRTRLPPRKLLLQDSQTCGFAKIGFLMLASLKRHLKRWHFVIYDIWPL